eukprot:scpid97656/ scgid26299/ 
MQIHHPVCFTPWTTSSQQSTAGTFKILGYGADVHEVKSPTHAAAIDGLMMGTSHLRGTQTEYCNIEFSLLSSATPVYSTIHNTTFHEAMRNMRQAVTSTHDSQLFSFCDI